MMKKKSGGVAPSADMTSLSKAISKIIQQTSDTSKINEELAKEMSSRLVSQMLQPSPFAGTKTGRWNQMANNYSQFSTGIYDLTDEEKEWINRVMCTPISLGEYVEYRDMHTVDQIATNREILYHGEPEKQKLKHADDDDDYWPRFDWQITDSSKSDKDMWWLYCGESFNLDHVIMAVQAFLRTFRPKEYLVMSWADTCGKPRIDVFGGGACIITADKWDVMSTYLQMDLWAKEMGEKGRTNAGNPKPKEE